MIEMKDFKGGIKGIPQFQDRQQMWNSSLFSKLDKQFPAMNDYLQALRTVYTNGKVEFLSLEVKENELFDWYASRNQFHEMGFFHFLWESEPIKSELKIKPHDLNFYSTDVFSCSSSFTFAGELADVLNSGGAYDKHEPGALHAKKLADNAAADTIQDLYDECFVFHSHTPWSNFFYDIFWDHSWIIINKQTRQIFCLLATDTD